MDPRYPHTSYHYRGHVPYSIDDFLADYYRSHPAAELADEWTERMRKAKAAEPESMGLCVFCDGEDGDCFNCGGNGYV